MSLNLKSLQEKMVEAIIDQKISPCLAELIRPGGQLRGEREALEVYQKGYPARLSDALGETYEGVWSVLGDEEFFSLCERFIKENRSESFNLSDYDVRFSSFLERQGSLIEEFPFLPELAFFEWQFHKIFHSPVDETRELSAEELAEVNEDSKFCLVSSLRIFSFAYSTYRIWQQRKNEERELFDFHSPECLCLFKVGEPGIRSLYIRDWQYQIIDCLQKGLSLGEALDQANRSFEMNEGMVQEIFSLLIRHQLIKEIS